MAYIRKMMRPEIFNSETQVQAKADHLWLLVDIHEDGTVEEPVLIFFADHAGLEAEFEAGTVTTVLEAAVASILSGLQGDALSTPQRGAMDDYPISEP